MMLTRHEDQKVTTQWYQKPIASGRFLNYHSFHPLNQKLNMAINFARRVNLLFTDLEDSVKIKIIDEHLKINGYPASLRHRLANHRNERVNNTEIQHPPGDVEYSYRSIPYIPHLSNMVDKVFKHDYKNIRLAKYNVKTVNNLFSKIKDPIPLDNQSNVVYHIPCSNCEAYIGMTTNRIRTRMSGHRTHYNTMDRFLDQGISITDPQITTLGERTALMKHSIEENHRFDLEKVRVLDRAKTTNKLQFLEMCHIKNNRHSINKRTDTDGLHAIYAGLLYKIEK